MTSRKRLPSGAQQYRPFVPFVSFAFGLSHAYFTAQFAGRWLPRNQVCSLHDEVAGICCASEPLRQVPNLTRLPEIPAPPTDHPRQVSSGRRPVGPHRKAYAGQSSVNSDHCSDSFGVGATVCAGLPGPSISSASPFIASLNPGNHRPIPYRVRSACFRQRVREQ